MRFFIATLGCKTNQSESDGITKALIENGNQYVREIPDADLCIINTCTVTSMTDKKTRQLIRRVKRQKKPSAKILVTGCYVRYNRYFLEKAAVDFIVENEKKDDIPDIVKDIFGKSPFRPTDIKELEDIHARPFIKVQEGCSQNCSYCIVPKVRGPYRSLPGEDILKEIKEYVALGYEEIVLTGIHIGKYGIEKASSLARLLDDILEYTDISRIRLSSLEVNELDDELRVLLEKNKSRIAPHFHIPLQSGSDRILKLMGRPYDSERYKRGIAGLLKTRDDVTITTDVIVGFPDESKKDFIATVRLLELLPFSKVHVFKFSPRKLTAAYDMGEKVDSSVKKERARTLIELGRSKREAFIKKNSKKVLEVVLERQVDTDYLYSGTSGNYIKTYFRFCGNDKRTGMLLRVKAERPYKDGLFGEVINNTRF